VSATASRRKQAPPPRQHTIGAVCRRLQGEFPDISISKIRYLEDQGLLAPRRTRGGYRLFGEEEIERLETILRLQRDEFLPLRVIRQELAAAGAATGRGKRRRPAGLAPDDEELDLDELCERAGVTRQFARELEEFGLLAPTSESGEKRYPAGDADVAAACSRISKYGVSARHLRTFRTAADREAALLEQIVAPALTSRNPERRQAGVEDLQALAELAQELGQLLFWRELRRFVAR
jgi:DNA-binding transcriptional MerR regulator